MNTICIPAGDNQNTCTLLLSHSVICAQYNIGTRNREREHEEGQKKIVSMMRGVIVDLNLS